MVVKRINLEECDVAIRRFIESLMKNEVIIFAKNGEVQYVLGGIDDFEWEVFALGHNQEFLNYLNQARQRGKKEGTIPIAEVRRRLDIPVETREVLVPA